jgi:ABC-type multidrug transport system ATPase subunit
VATLVVLTRAVLQQLRQGAAEKRSRGAPGRPSSPAAVETAAGTPVGSPKQAAAGLSFSFIDLSVSVPLPGGRSLPVLRSMSGSLPEGQFCAIMGPTACGKSTLLNALRLGGATPPIRGSTLTGTVRVALGGRRIGGQELRRRVGYVPQEDVLDRTLTVRELLTFNARARIDTLTSSDAAVVVTRTLAELGLTGCADTVIGGGANAAANISGGQAKRVNIALELVSLSTSGEPGAALLW